MTLEHVQVQYMTDMFRLTPTLIKIRIRVETTSKPVAVSIIYLMDCGSQVSLLANCAK